MRILIARWRWYPISPGRQLLSDLEAAKQLKTKYIWHKSITPIPDRGDERTRASRIHNLKKGISSVNNYLIVPNQAFSLASLIGEPTVGKGYREGPAFVGGVVSNDIGGGLCLIATGLFQLFLYSGCKIVERHSHSIDAYGEERFYTLGEDAAISYALKDLVVKNIFSVPLLVQVKISDGMLECCLCGNEKNPLAVRVKSLYLIKSIQARIRSAQGGLYVPCALLGGLTPQSGLMTTPLLAATRLPSFVLRCAFLALPCDAQQVAYLLPFHI